MKKNKVTLTVTATRTKNDNEFKGSSTFKSAQGSSLEVTYLCKNPQNDKVNICFTDNDEDFTLEGTPSAEMFEALTDRQKHIAVLTFHLLDGAIQSAQMLSNNTTQVMREFEADMSGEGCSDFHLTDEAYSKLFSDSVAT